MEHHSEVETQQQALEPPRPKSCILQEVSISADMNNHPTQAWERLEGGPSETGSHTKLRGSAAVFHPTTPSLPELLETTENPQSYLTMAEDWDESHASGSVNLGKVPVVDRNLQVRGK